MDRAEATGAFYRALQFWGEEYGEDSKKLDGRFTGSADNHAAASRDIRRPHIGGDKFGVWPGHNYSIIYASILAHYVPRRGSALRLCEIGVFRGESLAVWTQVLPRGAEVLGIDGNIRPWVRSVEWLQAKGAFPHGYPRVLELDTIDGDHAAVADGTCDVLVDDGGHQPHHQVATFRRWWRKVRVDGAYVIEDVKNASAMRAVTAGVLAAAPAGAALCAPYENILVIALARELLLQLLPEARC